MYFLEFLSLGEKTFSDRNVYCFWLLHPTLTTAVLVQTPEPLTSLQAGLWPPPISHSRLSGAWPPGESHKGLHWSYYCQFKTVLASHCLLLSEHLSFSSESWNIVCHREPYLLGAGRTVSSLWGTTFPPLWPICVVGNILLPGFEGGTYDKGWANQDIQSPLVTVGDGHVTQVSQPGQMESAPGLFGSRWILPLAQVF